MSVQRDHLRLAVRWLQALGGDDPLVFEDLLAEDVVWSGVPEGAWCDGRGDVMALLGKQMAEGLPDAYALECVAGERGFVVGYRAGDLTAVDDVALPGQVFNVMAVVGDRIAIISDCAKRADALEAAGVADPGWV